jgi:hypothetical protein
MRKQCLQAVKMLYRVWHLGLRTDAAGEGSQLSRLLGRNFTRSDGWLDERELNAEML